MNDGPGPFGARLHQLRNARGWSRDAVSIRLGVGESTVADWELGDSAHQRPRLETLIKLADLYDVSLDFLIAGRTQDGLDERGIAWRLAWSRPSAAVEDAARMWRQLMAGLSPPQIAAEFSLARASDVDRLIEDLVVSEQVVVEGVAQDRELEALLARTLTDRDGQPCLKEVRVANVASIRSDYVRYVLLGYVAKEYFTANVRTGNSVGLSGGFSVSRLVHALRPGECPAGIRVLPLVTAPVFEKASVSANSVVSALAYRHRGVQASELPFVFASERDHRRSLPYSHAQRILIEAADVDFAFTGVGLLNTPSLVTNPDVWVRSKTAAAGDLLYHPIGARGEDLLDPTQELICSIGLTGLRQLAERDKRVVVIASGMRKADVTRAAVVAGYVNVLIVDDELARALL